MRFILSMPALVSAAAVLELSRSGGLTAVFFPSALSLIPSAGLLDLVKASIVTPEMSSTSLVEGALG